MLRLPRFALPAFVALVASASLVACHSSVELFGEDGGDGRSDASMDGGGRDLGTDASDPFSCGDAVSSCYEGANGMPYCCVESDIFPDCREGRWVCPEGTYEEAECGVIQATCEGSGGIYDDCDTSLDCVLVGNYCCPVCGAPANTDVRAVNASQAEAAYVEDICLAAAMGPVDCPECPTADNPNLAAYCDATGFRAQCQVIDLGNDVYRACEEDRDCELTVAECCPCGTFGEGRAIAVNDARDVQQILCGDTDCPTDCEPSFGELVPACVGGVCVVAP
ncbi:MAG: hypothetical protein CMN30_09990 [Sandaracinus sp.]|nr:hypothetical protein [Sandaracinus sp.]|tara:strand:+ start:317 stop:1153 length:837 start_codon:yes stop_codon:yes gene_type:complete